MSSFQGPENIDRLLRDGLSQISVPEPSAEFDRRVRAGLHAPERKALGIWPAVRAMLVPAACSLALTLTLLKFCSAPIGESRPGSQAPERIAMNPARSHTDKNEWNIDHLDSETPTLSGFRSRIQMSN